MDPPRGWQRSEVSGDVGPLPTPRVSGSFPAPLPTVAQRVRRFWDPPDDFLLDAGKSGEILIARIRLGVMLVLLMIPLLNLAPDLLQLADQRLFEAKDAGRSRVVGPAKG